MLPVCTLSNLIQQEFLSAQIEEFLIMRLRKQQWSENRFQFPQSHHHAHDRDSPQISKGRLLRDTVLLLVLTDCLQMTYYCHWEW